MLAEALVEALPSYDLVPEPYRLLEEEGHECGEMPSLEDFERQLERSFQCVEESGPTVVFDRCPLDIVAYLQTHEDAEWFDLENWMPRIREHVAALDVIVFVPVEEPDRIAVPRSQARLRTAVDAVLRDIVLDDAYGLKVDVIEVTGSLGTRLHQVMAHIRRAGSMSQPFRSASDSS